MILQVGKCYIRRDGTLVKIIRQTGSSAFPFMDDTFNTYCANGRYQQSENTHPKDILTEMYPEDSGAVTQASRTVASSDPKPHKHAAIIKAWADGSTIEYKGPEMTEWKTLLPAGVSMTLWRDDVEYRVKQGPHDLYFVVYKNLYNGDLFGGASYPVQTQAQSIYEEATNAVALLSVTLDRDTLEPVTVIVRKKGTQ